MNDLELFNDDLHYYADRKYITNSSLKKLRESPVLFKMWLDKKNVDDSNNIPALRQGKAIHAWALEGKNDFKTYSGVRRGKEWDAYAKEHQHSTILTPKEAKDVEAWKVALDKCAEVQDLMNNTSNENVPEVPAIGEWGGVAIKGKADLVVTPKDFSESFLVDLKTTGGTLAEFRRKAYLYDYDMQAAFYTHLFGVKDMLFVVVEKKFPYHIGIYKASEQFIASGAKKANEAIEMYNHFFVDGNYKPYALADYGEL